jgi:hypothetical protein
MTETQNPFKRDSDPELSAIFTQLVGLKKRVDGQLVKAERMAGFGENARFLPLLDVKLELPSVQSIHTPGENNRFYRPVIPLEQVEATAREYIAKARAQIAEVEAKNAEALLHNRNLCQQVTDLMTRIGIASSYTTYELPSPRHKTRKTIPHSAGYLNDLQRVTPKSNAYQCKLQVDEYERRLPGYITQWRAEEVKKNTDSDAQAIEKFISQKPGIVALLIKTADIGLLTLLSTAEPGQKMGIIKESITLAIDTVLKKNKYLRLAYYLEKNRNDWNDGYDFAETGLDGFTIENGTDQEIYDEIQGLIDNWNNDGRVFRDCTWNYSVLYQLVGPQSDLVEQLEQLTALEQM